MEVKKMAEVKEPTDLMELEASEAVTNRENFERDIKNLWGHSALGIEAKKAAMTMLSTKTGMYARIPLTCKADSCPYAESCKLLPYNLAPLGEPCPIETAEIELRYASYEEDFELDMSSFTDKNLVSEIINLDIMAERCKALMAKEGVPVVEVVAGITEQGEEFTRPEVSKYWEAYEKTLKRRGDLYDMMMATRKSKKNEGEQAKSLTQILADMQNNGTSFVIEQKPDHLVDVSVD